MTGTDPQAESPTVATVYYFDGDALTPVNRELHPGEGLEGVAQSMLAPAPGRLSSALSGVEISEVSVDGDLITVEVDEGFVDAADAEVARRAGSGGLRAHGYRSRGFGTCSNRGRRRSK